MRCRRKALGETPGDPLNVIRLLDQLFFVLRAVSEVFLPSFPWSFNFLEVVPMHLIFHCHHARGREKSLGMGLMFRSPSSAIDYF